MKQKILFLASVIVCVHANAQSNPIELPAHYFRLLDAGVKRIEERLSTEPGATLASLESQEGWKHFPNAILMPAVLYTKSHVSNKHFGDTAMLQLALRIGDLLVTEYNEGHYTSRGDNDWDTYMWLEAYRLLEKKLSDERRTQWKEILLKELSSLEPKLIKCENYPWYNAPFITTSPNHYSIYASTLLVGGHVFDTPEWIKLSTKVLHRFCVEEQTPDGYWGEHSRAGPTTGYDYLTVTQIALYWEYSKDTEALKALRRSTDFHKYFTYPDGTPVETINDRNRYWGVSMWGHFGFSHFADGRRYAAFLTSFFPYGGDTKSYGGDLQSLGRIAQDALYFHEGKTESIPQDEIEYAHAMHEPAGIRKTGDWVVTYSCIIAPPVSLNNFFLDRQSHFSVFNKKSGLIISGANSKRQPELATFEEAIGKDSIHMPLSSRLQMSADTDKLALAYNVFFAVLEVPKPTRKQLKFRFATTYKWGDAVSKFHLQLMLKEGDTLETGTGRKIILGKEKIELSSDDLSGMIRNNGWTLRVPAGMHLTWPVYPFNPYKDAPETELDLAIGVLSATLQQKDEEFPFSLEVE
jgi:hypothetical protein